jgi:hypothetical protein
MGLFLEQLMGAPEVKPLLSDEHFSVDGTLLQAWASHASLKRIDGQEDPPPPPSGPGEGFGAAKEGMKRAKGDFRGVKLSNETAASLRPKNAIRPWGSCWPCSTRCAAAAPANSPWHWPCWRSGCSHEPHR